MSRSGSGRGHRIGGGVWAMLAGALTVALGAGGLPAAAPAATVQFAATIDGAQETPPTMTGAMANGTFVMDTEANTLTIDVVITVPPPSGEIAAHIHGFAGPGVPAGILFGLDTGSPKNDVWNFSEAQEANIIAGLTYINIHSTDFPLGEIRGQILRVPACGDGIVDGGEQCDDGNTDDGDCCDSACQLDPMGAACGDGLCSTGECDGAGTCTGGGMRTGCLSAGKASLLLKNNDDDNKDKLVSKWLKGEATALDDFGQPAGTTAYALCIYAGTAAVATYEIAPGSSWSPAGTKGFKYKDKTGSSDGIQKVILKSGVTGKAKAIVKGKGANLADPPAGPFALPVTVQLVNSLTPSCWESVFDSGDIKKNEPGQFKAKASSP